MADDEALLARIRRRLRLPPRRLVLWHTVAAVPMGTVVVLGAYLSYHYHQLVIENRERVDHAYQVLDVVDGLYISLQNADVAQRDYIVTGDASRLQSFTAALREEERDAKRLQVLFAQAPQQGARLARLDQAASAKLDELGRTIAVRSQQGFEAAREIIRHNDQGRAMDDIRRQVIAMSEAEHRLLMKRQTSLREHERNTLLVGVFIAALSIATRILIALGLNWYHRRQRRLHADIASGQVGKADRGDDDTEPEPAARDEALAA
ncbi:MAG: CHASE3 domain-containing protein [Burkholderiaceae bacterium]